MIMFATVVIDAIIGNNDPVFDYTIPKNLHTQAQVGSRVFVPFGSRKVEGFILSIKDNTEIDISKLKEVQKIPDGFIALKPEIIQIAPSICKKFKLRLIDVLRLFVPATVRSRKRTRVVENKKLQSLDLQEKNIVLTKEQQAVIHEVLNHSDDLSPFGKQPVFLLHGVTGSGKTEVYMNVITQLLKQGKTAIMLVPEIGLTPQVLANFRLRFGDTIAMIHSGLGQREKYD